MKTRTHAIAKKLERLEKKCMCIVATMPALLRGPKTIDKLSFQIAIDQFTSHMHDAYCTPSFFGPHKCLDRLRQTNENCLQHTSFLATSKDCGTPCFALAGWVLACMLWFGEKTDLAFRDDKFGLVAILNIRFYLEYHVFCCVHTRCDRRQPALAPRRPGGVH